MMFHPIDMQDWARAPYYEHYMNAVRCGYSISANIDITALLPALKRQQRKLYTAFICMTSVIANRHECFKTAISEEGVLGIWDSVSPSYTVFHDDDKTFSTIWTTYVDRPASLYNALAQDMAAYQSAKGPFPKPDMPKNTFCLSCVPWVRFTSMNINIFEDGMYLPPIITSGKYFTQEGKTFLPVCLQTHHAVADGYHAGLFFEELQALADGAEDFFEKEEPGKRRR